MRRFRTFPLGDLLVAQAIPGFLLCVGWAVMYEIYHEDGSYYTTLMQEILSEEGFFTYFLIAAALMAFPVGMVIDTVREVVGERWLRIPRIRSQGGAGRSPLSWMSELPLPPDRFSERYLLYQHAWATVLTPAKTAGNLSLIVCTFLIWFVVKIVRMQGWHIFSLPFIIGTPIVGLALAAILALRYAAGLAEFHRLVRTGIFPPPAPTLPSPTDAAPPATP